MFKPPLSDNSQVIHFAKTGLYWDIISPGRLVAALSILLAERNGTTPDAISAQDIVKSLLNITMSHLVSGFNTEAEMFKIFCYLADNADNRIRTKVDVYALICKQLLVILSLTPKDAAPDPKDQPLLERARKMATGN